MPELPAHGRPCSCASLAEPALLPGSGAALISYPTQTFVLGPSCPAVRRARGELYSWSRFAERADGSGPTEPKLSYIDSCGSDRVRSPLIGKEHKPHRNRVRKVTIVGAPENRMSQRRYAGQHAVLNRWPAYRLLCLMPTEAGMDR
jgi:hypothetical protein